MNSKSFSSKLFLLVGLMVFSFQMNAQQSGKNFQNREQMKQKMEAQKVAFITEQLQLTEVEAQKFWPIYNKYQEDQKALKSSSDDTYRKEMSDKEAEAFLNTMIKNNQKQLDLHNDYITKLKSILPASKIARLVTLDKEFKRRVMRNMKERSSKRRGR